jgi:hypothetical protein
LKECGVFGVASDEYLAYAVENRREWETRGKAIVNDMVKKVTNTVENDRELESRGKALVNHVTRKVNTLLADMRDEIAK